MTIQLLPENEHKLVGPWKVLVYDIGGTDYPMTGNMIFTEKEDEI